MSWYRTYRPQQLKDLHLVSVRDQLLKMVKSGSVPHALLFVGPKGTGKTSSARIIAKIVNCEKNAKRKASDPFVEPCLKCDQCIAIQKGSAVNVVEMDAASSRRIDDIRELRDRIYMPPAMGRKLVYIIDEVHMLTTEAFNALLKILEEPPEHALFILATTEAHKIPETIRSRCTSVLFHTASDKELASALQSILDVEKIEVEDTIIELIAQQSQGSFRDGVKILQQIVESVSPSKKIALADVETLIHGVTEDSVAQFCQSILQKDEHALIAFFQQIRTNDIDARAFLKRLLEYLHTEWMKTLGVEQGTAFASQTVIMFLLKQYGNLVIDERLPFPLLPLELLTLEMVLKSKGQKSGNTPSGGSKPAPPTAKKVIASASSKTTTQQASGSDQNQISQEITLETSSVEIEYDSHTDDMGFALADESIESGLENALLTRYKVDTVIPENSDKMDSANQADGALIQARWADFLSSVGSTNLSLEALLRSSQFVRGEPGKVVIQVFYQFHKEQLELDRYRTIVESALLKLIGGNVRCEYVLADVSQAKKTADANISGAISEDAVALIAMAEEALM